MDMNINGRRRIASSGRTIALLIMSIVFTGAIGVVMLVDTFAGTALAAPSGRSIGFRCSRPLRARCPPEALHD